MKEGLTDSLSLSLSLSHMCIIIIIIIIIIFFFLLQFLSLTSLPTNCQRPETEYWNLSIIIK